jgi:hypothetical protein
MAIPLPERSGHIVGRAFDSIGSILDKAREHAMEQWKLKEMVKQHQEEMKLRQSAEGRAAELFPLQKHAAKLANDKATRESNPNYEAEKIMNGLKYFESMRNGGGKTQEPSAEQPNFQGQQQDVLGLTTPGNIDLNHTPQGAITPDNTMTIDVNGKNVVIPMVDSMGKQLNAADAIEQYKNTGAHLGEFDTPENANQYLQSLALQAQQETPPAVTKPLDNDNLIERAKAAFLKKNGLGPSAETPAERTQEH